MPLSPDKLAALLAARRMTQAELARLSGLPRPRISEITRGRRVAHVELAIAERLAVALRVPLDRLLD